MAIPLATVERIMRNGGATNLTEGAVEELRDSAEEIADEVAADAVRIARDNGHDAVTAEDIRQAVEA